MKKRNPLSCATCRVHGLVFVRTSVLLVVVVVPGFLHLHFFFVFFELSLFTILQNSIEVH